MSVTLCQAAYLAFPTLQIALHRTGDENVLPHIHVFFVFLSAVLRAPSAVHLLGGWIPWTEMAAYLNALPKLDDWRTIAASPEFPVPDLPLIGRPLPEDYAMRGQVWSQNYFPPRWFEACDVDEDERSQELDSMAMPRIERVFWLAVRIARVSLSEPDRYLPRILLQLTSL
jgi:hypothetical protein